MIAEVDTPPAPLVLVTGVGTGIGKTHFAEALVRAWARRAPRVVGYKPIESGVEAGVPNDQTALDRASTFHVKHHRVELGAPLSPHLAARREGRPLDLPHIVEHVRTLCASCDGVVVELAGGAFSPLDDARTNADLVAMLAEPHPRARVVLVASDRLGVLHDVIASLRALAHGPTPLHVDGIVLQTPAHVDASTGLNGDELARWASAPVTVVPRGAPHDDAVVTAAGEALRTLRVEP